MLGRGRAPGASGPVPRLRVGKGRGRTSSALPTVLRLAQMPTAELLRRAVVAGSAMALILAGPALPALGL